MSITAISIIVGVVLLVGIILASYVKAPPSVAFLISGLKGTKSSHRKGWIQNPILRANR